MGSGDVLVRRAPTVLEYMTVSVMVRWSEVPGLVGMAPKQETMESW